MCRLIKIRVLTSLASSDPNHLLHQAWNLEGWKFWMIDEILLFASEIRRFRVGESLG